MKLSCVTASYVADLIGYPGEVDWDLASRTIEASPLLETVDGLLARLAPAKLDGIEFWYPHVAASKLTPALASALRRRLAAHGQVCSACAGGVTDPDDDPYRTEEAFQIAVLLGAPVIAGHVPAATIRKLGPYSSRYGVRMAFENGGEKDAMPVLKVTEGGGQWLGAAIDTGNMAAQGGDPVLAIRQLGRRIIHVHFKDVPAVGSHDCVAPGKGIVDVKAVIRELKAFGYDGWLSIEIETGDRDPTDEIVASAETLRELWGR